MKKNNPIFLSLLLLVLIACQSQHDDGHSHGDDAHSHSHAEPDAHSHGAGGHSHGADDAHMEEEGEEVGLTKEQMQKINLQLGVFEQKNLNATLKVNGVLELPPQNKADVSTILAGKINRIVVRQGQYVKRGATLATLSNPELIDWQQDYMEQQASLIFLDKEQSRLQDLVSKEIAAQKDLDKVISEIAMAKVKMNGLQSKMQTLGIPTPTMNSTDLKTNFVVSSPISGFVRDININMGSYVQPAQSLFHVVDNHHLHIDFKVFEKDLPKIKKGQVINFNLQSQPKNVMQAKIFAIGKALNETDRTLPVHAEIINEKMELVTGMYVEGRIILKDEKIAALPEEAITIDKGLHYIFVKEDEHDGETHFKKVAVLKGTADQGYIAVTPIESLSPFAEIVTEGAYFLMAQSKKGEAGVGHHH